MDELGLALRGLVFVLVVGAIGAFIKWSRESAQDDADERKYGYRRNKKPTPLQKSRR